MALMLAEPSEAARGPADVTPERWTEAAAAPRSRDEAAAEEGHGLTLRPRAPTERRLEESRVATFERKQRLEPRRTSHRLFGESRGGDERVVDGVDQEARSSDCVEVARAARLVPVISLVREAVERRGDVVVVLGEGSRPQRGRHVDLAVVEVRLGPDLGPHGPQEVRRVEGPRQTAVEHTGARGEIEGRRDDGRAHHGVGGAFSQLAEPLEGDVAAERDAHQPDPARRLALAQALDDRGEIGGLAG